MHFPVPVSVSVSPKSHHDRSKSNSSSCSTSSSERSAERDKSPVKSPATDEDRPRERPGEGEEEEVTEWIEGRDIVIERKSCIPGEDVQVEVLRGAAPDTHHSRHEEVKKPKEALTVKRRGQEGKEHDLKLMGKCRDLFVAGGHTGHPGEGH